MSDPLASAPNEPEPDRGEVTELLNRWHAGEQAAGDEVARRLHAELRALAASRLRGERGAVSLEPTELVNEVFMRLVGGRMPSWESRGHFFAIAARQIRQILVSRARHRSRQKRGGGVVLLDLDRDQPAFPALAPIDLLALEVALDRLAAADPVAAEVVELRFYGGLSLEEVASALDIGRSTAVRKFRAARAFIREHLTGTD